MPLVNVFTTRSCAQDLGRSQRKSGQGQDVCDLGAAGCTERGSPIAVWEKLGGHTSVDAARAWGDESARAGAPDSHPSSAPSWLHGWSQFAQL